MNRKTKYMALCGLFAALLTLCAWICIPIPPVTVTLQTLGVLLALGLLGGRWGSLSIGIYLLLGLAGAPAFAGFRGGAAALLDPTGGFLWGFLAGGLCYWALVRLGRAPAMAGCMLAVYLSGCIWYRVYAPEAGFAGAVLTCVVPYLVPDGLKLWLALVLTRRLRRQLPL